MGYLQCMLDQRHAGAAFSRTWVNVQILNRGFSAVGPHGKSITLQNVTDRHIAIHCQKKIGISGAEQSGNAVA